MNAGRRRSIRPQVGLGLALLALALTRSLLSAWAGAAPAASQAGPSIPAACGGFEPYFLATAYADVAAAGSASLVALRLQPDGRLEQTVLATQAQVGSVHGLAVDAARQLAYVGAFYRLPAGFGPGGPGAIYRIDLASGAVSQVADLPAGPARLGSGAAERAERWIGRSSLGDLALDEPGETLFASNLHTGRIHRIDLVGHQDLAPFPHGATGESWAASARLFGLLVEGGRLYHAVVDTGGRSSAAGGPVAWVYASALDGSGMQAVGRVELGAAGWRTWADELAGRQPMVTGLAMGPDGLLALGLRSRHLDLSGPDAQPAGVGGQVLTTTGATPGRLSVLPSTGGLARVAGLDLWVTAGREGAGLAASYFDPVRGLIVRQAGLAQAAGLTIGDIEGTCPNRPDPAVAATATAAFTQRSAAMASAQHAVAVATGLAYRATAGATSTAFAATGTAAAPRTATVAAQRAPTLAAACRNGAEPWYFATRFVYDNYPLAQGGYRPPVIEDDTVIYALTRQGQRLDLAGHGTLGATYGLAYDWQRGQLYAGAYLKYGSALGPGGPGAIYRLDLTSGAVDTWARLDAGPDTVLRGSDAHGGDVLARRLVGTMGLGDLELDVQAGELFAVNLLDRRIHRLSLPDGRHLGSFPHGGAHQPWAANARPFGLGLRGGYLYHGVVDSGEEEAPGPLAGYVYRSRFDGTDMMEVARFDLGYARGDRDRDLGWRPWSSQWVDLDPSAWQHAGPYWSQPEAMLSDIEFRPDGSLILGLRDRSGDLFVSNGAADGDTLRTRPLGPGWEVLADDFYRDEGEGTYIEAAWGGLAGVHGRDQVASTFFSPVRYKTGAVVWFDNRTGERIDSHTLYGPSYLVWGTFDKAHGLGDLESICPPADGFRTPEPSPSPPPTPTVTTSATPSASPTGRPTLSPTPSASPTATATVTPSPGPIYLPVTLAEACTIHRNRADLVLVVDLSTSMLRPAGGGSSKLAAVQQAARLLVARMDLAGGDRVALLGFHASAFSLQPMTGNAADLGRALDQAGSHIAPGTRLDLAVSAGLAALPADGVGARRPVLVLLTDGIPNGVPTPPPAGSQADTVLAAAELARRRGVMLYTVGFGRADAPDPADRIDPVLLRGMATRPELYFEAPDSAALQAIYGQIADAVACPPERRWGLGSGAPAAAAGGGTGSSLPAP